MHANNIVHRDLKPTNCLIDKDFQLNIIDFGIALDLTSKHHGARKDGTIIGTPYYMAPEVFK